MLKAPKRIHTHTVAFAMGFCSLSLCAPALAMDEAATTPPKVSNPCLTNLQPLEATASPLSLTGSSAFEIEGQDRKRFRLTGLVTEGLVTPALAVQKAATITGFLEHEQGTVQIFLSAEAKPDRYGRLAAFIASPADHEADSNAIETLQDRLLEEGLARVDPEPLTPSCAQHLLAIESRARTTNRGLWKEDHYSVKDAKRLHLSAILSTYQLVTGTVRSVSRRPEKTSYLNFSRNWNEDFTVTLSKKSLASWEGMNKSLDELDQAPIYVRGWIEDRGGPLIRINHPQQLTITRDKY
ncbi:thermonuclease family protein [uncultured Cohaesibacter sp.]|uniref:thermonuclease family protein n=1 Tax=uncultured Cohaesibacter sp. TaxID=1002546 RepID=UPI0029C7228B|nr:thermonuclease family protein [uncultured Cohaesibacter sp.]